MPIDPSVLTPTLIKPISVAGVVDDMARVQQSRAQAEVWRQKSQELARDQQENDQIRAVMQQSGGQLDEPTLNAIRQISPTKAMDIEKLHNDSTKSSIEIQNAKIDHDLKVLGYTSRQLAGITDQHSYDMARAGIKATTGQDLPEQYDPALVQAWQEKGMTYAEKLNQAREDRMAKFQELTANRQQSAEERAQAREERMAGAQQQQLGMERQRLGLEGKRVSLEEQRLAKGASGEGGRGVTSKDAGSIADMDASIAQLRELKKQFGGDNPSGLMANVETYLPPGLGTAAKSKQAKIDIVRQLVGKGLEGGVLRKEDEVKYAKILPIVSDADALAASKIDGAIAAIQQKKADHLDSLQDAGYDVSKFRARQQTAPSKTGPGPKADPLGIR